MDILVIIRLSWSLRIRRRLPLLVLMEPLLLEGCHLDYANALATFQRCMMSIFSDLVEEAMEIFMDDFSVYGSSFENCLQILEIVL